MTVIGQDHVTGRQKIGTGQGHMIRSGPVSTGRVPETGIGQSQGKNQGQVNIDQGQGQKKEGNIKNINTRDDHIADDSKIL